MGNTSQKVRHISGDDTGPSLTAGRFVDGSFDTDPYTGYGQGVAYQKRARAATSASQAEVNEPKQRLLPTVFKWEGGGKEVFLTGSFNNWKTKIPLVKSHGDFYTIVDLPEGDHQYKFFVDGQWVHDASEPAKQNSLGTLNNVMRVKQSDFEVFEALDLDSLNSPHKKSDMLLDHNMLGIGPIPWHQMPSDPGPYPCLLGHSPDQCLQLPELGEISGSPSDDYGQDIPVRRPGEKQSGPPILPPHLLQVLLNKDTPAHCEPTLLPEPNHVMLNHLYALSIKDGVMVLSATHRFRKKYVTTLLYKPI